MQCPKCGARIGMYQRSLNVSIGEVLGASCYVCGFWRNEHVPPIVAARSEIAPNNMP